MPTYFNTYPETPDMGLRESINAMLAHVADNSRPFGYLPSAIHQANYESLLEYFPNTVTPDTHNDYLTLVPRVENNDELRRLVEVLEGLCNDYPVYDDERMTQIELDRLIEMLNETRKEDDPSAEDIAWALFEIGAYVEQSEYGANISDDDYEAAIAYVRREEARELAEAAGQVELF